MKHQKFRLTASLVAVVAVAGLPACAQQNATQTPISSVVAGNEKPFVHPGLIDTEADFARMKAKVAAGEQPWLDGWNKLIADRRAQLNWGPRPQVKVVRGGAGQNFAVLLNDVAAAYDLAVRWKVSGDTAYADKSIDIMNQWSAKFTELTGNSDRFLAAGIYGSEFANAAEVMRTYPGWKPEDFARFQNMMLTIFYPMNNSFLTKHNGAAITNYWANWDLANIAAMQAIGVLCDRRDIYDEAMNYVKEGRGNGAIDKAVYYVHPGNLGQWQEAGRDQGHSTLGIALMGPIMETAWNQGDDLYGYDNNRFLAGAEYVAKYNLGNDVPFQTYAWGTGPQGKRVEQTRVSGSAAMRDGYEMVVNHYVNRKGIAAPYSEQYAAKLRPESGGGDQLGFGTLTATIEPQVQNPKPTGLTAHKSAGDVVLSWWGAAGATSYNVKRATKAGGPYTVIAPNVKDGFTFTDTNLQPGTYYYAVSAVKDGKETTTSDEVTVSATPILQTHLKFDAANGTQATDAVSNAPLATLHGGATWSDGKIGNAVSLNGKDGYVSLPAGVASDLSDFTIAAWIYLNASQRGARVFDFGDDRGRSMLLSPRVDNGKMRFVMTTTYFYNQQSIDSSEELPLNQWIHVAVTLSGHVGTLYVNGVAVGSNTDIDFPPFRIGNMPNSWIGRAQKESNPYFNGKVDDFRIYNGALTAEQIAALANTVGG